MQPDELILTWIDESVSLHPLPTEIECFLCVASNGDNVICASAHAPFDDVTFGLRLKLTPAGNRKGARHSRKLLWSRC
jgi:hypothetical protein